MAKSSSYWAGREIVPAWMPRGRAVPYKGPPIPRPSDEEIRLQKQWLAEQEKLDRAKEAARLEGERARNSQRGAGTRYLDTRGQWSSGNKPYRDPLTGEDVSTGPARGAKLPPLTAKQIEGLPRPETIPEDQ